MKQKIKNINKTAFIILSLYSLFIIWSRTFLSQENFPSFFQSILFLICACGLSFLYFQLFSKKWFDIKPNQKISKKNFFIPLIISLTVLYLYYFAYYPGIMVYDSIEQIRQITENSYSNWHPFIQTFLFYKIPLEIFNFRVESIVFIQNIYFSLAFSYMIYVLRKLNYPKKLCIINIIISLFSYYAVLTVSPQKDSSFTIFTMLTFSFYIQICYIKNYLTVTKAIIFGIILTLCSLVRNNAPLYTFFIILNLFILAKSKTKYIFISILTALISYLIIEFPLQSFYNVKKLKMEEYFVLETSGIPFMMIGKIAKENWNEIPKNEQILLNKILPKEKWRKYYHDESNWNGIKWGSNMDLINKMKYKDIFKLTYNVVKIAPQKAIFEIIHVTQFLWNIGKNSNYFKKENVYYNTKEIPQYKELDIIYKANEYNLNIKYIPKTLIKYSQNILYVLEDIYKNIPFLHSIGIYLYILIIMMFTHFSKNSLHALPVLSYICGTALLLTTKETRFFTAMWFVIQPTIFITMAKKIKN